MPRKRDYAAELPETGPRRTSRTPSRHEAVSLPGSPYLRPGSAATLHPPLKASAGGTRVDAADLELYAPSSPSKKGKGKQPMRGTGGGAGIAAAGGVSSAATVAERVFAEGGLMPKIVIRNEKGAEKRKWSKPTHWNQRASPGSVISFAILSDRALNVADTFPPGIEAVPLTYEIGDFVGEGRAVVSQGFGAVLKPGKGFAVEKDVDFVGPGGVPVLAKHAGLESGDASTPSMSSDTASGASGEAEISIRLRKARESPDDLAKSIEVDHPKQAIRDDSESSKTTTKSYDEITPDDVLRLPNAKAFAIKYYLLPPGKPDELREAFRVTSNIAKTLPPDQTTIVPVLLQGYVLIWRKGEKGWEAFRWTALISELFQPLEEAVRTAPDAATKDRLLRSFVMRVAELNRAGWSGRDIKLDNGVVRPDGTVSLIDLGTAVPIGIKLLPVKVGSMPYIGPSVIARTLLLKLIEKEADLTEEFADGRVNDWLEGGADFALDHASAAHDKPMTVWKAKLDESSSETAEPDQDLWAAGASILEEIHPKTFRRLCKGLGRKVDAAKATLDDGGTRASFKKNYEAIRSDISELSRAQTWKADVPVEYHAALSMCFGAQANNSLQGKRIEVSQVFGKEFLSALDRTATVATDVTKEVIDRAQAQAEIGKELPTLTVTPKQHQRSGVFARTSWFSSTPTRLRPNVVQDPFSGAALSRIDGTSRYACQLQASWTQHEQEHGIDVQEPADLYFYGFDTAYLIATCPIPLCDAGGSGSEGVAPFHSKRWKDIFAHVDGKDLFKICSGLRCLPPGSVVEFVRWKWDDERYKKKDPTVGDDEESEGLESPDDDAGQDMDVEGA